MWSCVRCGADCMPLRVEQLHEKILYQFHLRYCIVIAKEEEMDGICRTHGKMRNA